jgi:hypothetical protein
MKRHAAQLIGALLCTGTLAIAAQATASPTGLNNIPTTDTPGHRLIVIQAYFTSDGADVNNAFAAFKGGLDLSEFGLASLRFEYGVDGRLGDTGAGPTTAQFKIATDPTVWADNGALDWTPSIAVGLSNLAFTSADRNDAGQPNPYLVLTKDLSIFRVHTGYAFASDNPAAFFGFDRAFNLGQTRFSPRFDITQIDDQAQWMCSAGFIWELNKRVAIEAWISQPFENGQTMFTLKFDFGFSF